MNIDNLKLNIAKLVFAYLVDNNYSKTAQSFINECETFQKNPNLIKNTLSNKSNDNLLNIVEDYFESKKYALIQSCNYLSSNYVKLKDVLSILYDNCGNQTTQNALSNNNSKPPSKRGRKRKVDSMSKSEQIVSFNPVENFSSLADFMADSINKNVPNFESTNFDCNFQMDQHQNHNNLNWAIDIDRQQETAKFPASYPTTDILQDIFLESLESVYPSESSLTKPLKRNDSLKTPEKEQLESLISGHSSSTVSFHAIPDNQQHLDPDLKHIWDSIYYEETERDGSGSSVGVNATSVEIVPVVEPVVRGDSLEDFKKAMEIQPIKSELKISKKTRPIISSGTLSVEEKQKILKNVDLNKIVGILKNKR